MLSNKNQKYIFERLLKNQSVLYQKLDEEHFEGGERFAFTDGVRIFIFSKEQIKFDISKCTLTDKLKEVLRGAASGRMYIPSEEIRANDNKGKTYRRLTPEGGFTSSVWVEDKFIKDYKGCNFVGCGGKNPLCVIDDYGDLIAAISPCDIDGSTIEETEE